MAPDPADRYPTVSDLQRDLERFLRGAWHLPTRTFPAGAAIVTENEEADAAYLLVEGRCTVRKQAGGEEVELRRLGPGDVFGETAIFSSAPRTATVQALDDVTVMVVDRESLTTGLGLDSWRGRFVRALADRFREVDDRLRRLEAASREGGKGGGEGA
jgi:serine/threonine-protein kinase